jgi:uncharacterized protein YndB with AHSA1/START domain
MRWSVDAVWKAISDPAQLETWFPTTVEFAELRPGAPIIPVGSQGRMARWTALYSVKY